MRLPAVAFAQTPEVRIGYFEFGSTAGTPLLLLHGFPDAPVAWNKTLERLDRDRLRVLVPYLRGFGPTEVLQPDLVAGQEAALARDVLAFADALGLDRFHLAGHDWGARASYATAVLAPERLLSLCGVASPYLSYGGGELPPPQIRAYWYQWFFQTERAHGTLADHRDAFCQELWRSWSPEWKFSRGEFSEAAKSWTNPQFVDIVLHYYRTRWGGALSRPPYSESQAALNAQPRPEISVPTLYIQGDADACTLLEASDGQNKVFTGPYHRVLLKGLGHFPHREDPKAVARLISAHVRKCA